MAPGWLLAVAPVAELSISVAPSTRPLPRPTASQPTVSVAWVPPFSASSSCRTVWKPPTVTPAARVQSASAPFAVCPVVKTSGAAAKASEKTAGVVPLLDRRLDGSRPASISRPEVVVQCPASTTIQDTVS